MDHSLTTVSQVGVDIESYLAHVGQVFWTFRNGDSRCTSYGVQAAGKRWFVKHSDDPQGLASLRNARDLNARVQHRALPRLYHTFETPGGLALVYEWVAGDLLYYPSRTPPERRHDLTFAPVRFRALPVPRILDALDTIYDLHLVLAERGYIAVDFYDGGILYDFGRSRTTVCDIDEYRIGPFVLDADRLFGSSRFMAPEEFQRGATIDQVTNVFTLGRTAVLLLGDGTGSLASCKGTEAIKRVIVRATSLERRERHASVRQFVEDWRSAVAERASQG